MPLNNNGLYIHDDISFVNISELTETSKYFMKHGVYTKAPVGGYEYKEFWDREEDKILNGVNLHGQLVKENGILKTKTVHITGEHYAYLNYGRIKKLEKLEDLKSVIKITSKEIKSGKKKIGFPDFWDGDYNWFKAKEYAENNNKHIAASKSRRKGFTYKEGFDAAITINTVPNSIVIAGAYDYKYITGQGQIMTMAKDYLDFLELHTDFNRGYLNTSDKLIKLGYIEEKSTIERGYKSSLIAMSFMDNEKAAIGKDARKIKLDECGNFPNLRAVLDVTLPTLKDGNIYTGLLTMFGATTKNSQDWADFEYIYYNPNSYDCLAFDNIYEEEFEGTSIGFFFPYSQNLITDGITSLSCIDENGNTLKNNAKIVVDDERLQKEKDLDTESFIIYKSQYCETPSEAFFGSSGGRFASPELLAHLSNVKKNPMFNNLARHGFIVEENNQLKFTFKLENGIEPIPIVTYPIKDKLNTDGCITEWFTPYKDKNSVIPDNLYVAVCDPFATDKEKGTITSRNSLGATYIYERPNNLTITKGDIIVASYIGRPLSTETYSENLFKLCNRWNAKLLYESDRGTILQDAKLLKQVELLIKEITLDYDKNLTGQTGRGYGLHMNTSRIEAAILYLSKWLKTKRSVDEQGNIRLNLHYIYDVALLTELSKWNSKGNFDRVSALLILMLLTKELIFKEVDIETNKNITDSFFDNFNLFS